MFETQFNEGRRRRRRKLTSAAVFTSLREEGSATLGDLLDRFGLEPVARSRVYRRLYELIEAHMIAVRVLPNNRGLYVANRGAELVDLEEWQAARRLEYRSKRDLKPKAGYGRFSIVNRPDPAILKALAKTKRPIGTTALAKDVKMHPATCGRHLRRLLAEGLVEYYCGLHGEYIWSLARN